ncbi:hypothetical protein KVG29_00650 [Caldicoprobacter algeriensis]|uniref:hypothetical protein n=1 Tax=Caldicoprobacter algeriensis TaxID=699281 RepID=UPI002079D223|nr:hypothetical protein [Caldicoprobacter algeriensis]MCM8899732.1 hypothetical protein [Caldicoprobacter algeriensis]
MGDKGYVTLDISQNWDEALNSHAVVMKLGGGRQEVSLQATQPGRYEGEFEIDEAGVYLVRVELKDGESVVGQLESGLAVSYLPEYDIRNRGAKELLERLVKETGGIMLDEPEQVFREDLHPVWVETEVWPYLLSAALVLFMVEVTLRRLKVEALLRRWASRIKIWEGHWPKPSAFEGNLKSHGNAHKGADESATASESDRDQGDVRLKKSIEGGSEVVDKPELGQTNNRNSKTLQHTRDFCIIPLVTITQ